jgi:hypothetical protein
MLEFEMFERCFWHAVSRKAAAMMGLLAVLTASGSAQSTFVTQQYPLRSMPESTIWADINGDGIPDLITASNVGAVPRVITTYIGNGDGSIQPGVEQVALSGSLYLASGDLDNDGKTDVVVSTESRTITVLWGNGCGGFVRQDFDALVPVHATVIADFNRDGKQDLAMAVTAELTPVIAKFGVDVLFGTGTRAFGVRQPVFLQDSNAVRGLVLNTGDFDGDARADLLFQAEFCEPGGCFQSLWTLFGSGTGSFASMPVSDSNYAYAIADVNQDGRSDLVGPDIAVGGDGPLGVVQILYGNGNRTFSKFSYDVNLFAEGRPAVADFNGDGRNDIALIVARLSNDNINTKYIDILYRLSDGGYSAPEEFAFATGADANIGFAAGVFSPQSATTVQGDHRQDLAVAFLQSQTLYVLTNNTASGYYGACGPLTKAEQIQICQPNSTASSNATFSVRANSFNPIRKLEVWVDGSKRSESYHNLGLEAWVDTEVPLSEGSHKASVVLANYDNRIIKKSFTFSVGASSCAQSSSPTATVICSPANGFRCKQSCIR